MLGTAFSGGMWAVTPTAAELTVDAEPGTYMLTWYTEVMRTTNGGGDNFFARARDVTANSTLGFMRHGLGVENGPAGAMPVDSDFFQVGDIFPFGGTAVVELSGGVQTFRLEYSMSFGGSSASALRARRQRLSLLRLD
jgi:hypothetical protein